MYEIWLQRFLVVLHSFLKPEVYESKVVEVVRFVVIMSLQENTKPGIMDLPEEILEQVLCLLCPYRDYKNVMLVCKLWHQIMQG